MPIQRRAKEEVEAAIQRYVDLYEFAPIAYVSFDRAGRIKEANSAATQLLGRPRRALIGTQFAGSVAKEDAALFLKHLFRCRSFGGQIDTELRLKRNGEIIPSHLSTAPTTFSSRNGTVLYQTAIADLTDRKKAEHALRRSQIRYRTLFDLVPIAVYACDAKGQILEFNQRAVELWGRKPKTNDPSEKFCGSFKIFYPDGRVMPHAKCPMARALRGEKFKRNELEIMVERANGARRSVVVNPMALKNERGKIIGAINCLYDITEQKRAEDALRESEELHRAFVSQTAVGMVRTDLKGRLVFVNKKFCEILGYRESELIGKTILELTNPDDIAESRRLFQGIVREGNPYQLEKRYIRKDRSLVWASVSASPICCDAQGRMQAAVAVIRDISERKQAQAALEKAKLLLETRVQERTSELIAANEELQNEITRRKTLEGEILEVREREQQEIGRELHDGICQHLTAVAFMTHSVAERLKNHRVVEVEDIEKIEGLINEGVTDARNIARSLHTLDVRAAEMGPALEALVTREIWTIPCRLEMHAPFAIKDDEIASHLYRILREAIINANKHSRAHVITVRVTESRNETVVSVIDDGTGIRKKRERTEGIGFHTMKYRARAMGARLEIKSTKPHGTRVTCYLPRQ
ncbi:MAG: PAS domain S-box protein [Verrucomicrobiota bacterium]